MAQFTTYLQKAQEMQVRDPDNTAPVYDMSNAHEKIGDALRAQGKFADALAKYREDLQVIASLTTRDPSNATWQRSLAVAYQRLGVTLRNMGDAPGAVAQYRQCLTIPVKARSWNSRNTWPIDVQGYCRKEIDELTK
jgi:Flp pilus assembly protein TadD